MKKTLIAFALSVLPLSTIAAETSVAPVTGPTRLAFGMATVSNLAGSGSGFGTTNGALSILYEASPWNSFQGMVAIGQTTPLEIGFGGIFRHTVTGGNSEGLHLGGGLLVGSIRLGTSSELYMRMSGLGGAHFTLPGLSRLQLSFDGGIHMDLINDNFDLRIEPLSPALGFSVHYFI